MAALLIRIAGMGHPLLPDEGYTWLVASAGTPGAFLSRLARYENTPPLYYLLLTPFSLHSVWLIRLPSLIAGVAVVAVVWAIVAPRFGRGGAAVAALAAAVAPYAVAESNFGRAYMLADIWLLLCFWAALRLTDEDSDKRWWWLYGCAAVLAIYTEYDAAAALLPLIAGLVLLRRDRWKQTLTMSLLPAVAFLPWIHQFLRSSHDFGVTKSGLGYLTVTPASIRDQLVALFYGRTGQNLGADARTLAAGLLLVVLIGAAVVLYRRGSDARPTLVLVVFAGLGTFVLHMAAALVGTGIFNVGYLTFVIPMGAVLIGAAVSSLSLRMLVPVACCALVFVGAGLAVQRLHEAPDIQVGTIRAILQRAHVHTILTNSAVVDYYFQSNGALLDRPFNLGPGRENDCGSCAQPIAVVDDSGVSGGARPGPGPVQAVGHYVVRLLPR
jgi:uncharacterized membrane protein